MEYQTIVDITSSPDVSYASHENTVVSVCIRSTIYESVVLTKSLRNKQRINQITCRSTRDDEYRADLGLLATGWSGLPAGATSSSNSVRPIRGATVRVQGLDRSSQPSVRAFVRGRAFYMVSRPGGYCVLGASADERADAVLEVGELQRLLRDGLDVVPELETAQVLETRIGLRPASPDLEPFFERLDLEGWAWSSGHYRSGVTLAPLAALEALDFVEGGA